MMMMAYVRAAAGYSNDADLIERYGPMKYYSSAKTARWRAWTCWSAAISGGLVVG